MNWGTAWKIAARMPAGRWGWARRRRGFTKGRRCRFMVVRCTHAQAHPLPGPICNLSHQSASGTGLSNGVVGGGAAYVLRRPRCAPMLALLINGRAPTHPAPRPLLRDAQKMPLRKTAPSALGRSREPERTTDAKKPLTAGACECASVLCVGGRAPRPATGCRDGGGSTRTHGPCPCGRRGVGGSGGCGAVTTGTRERQNAGADMTAQTVAGALTAPARSARSQRGPSRSSRCPTRAQSRKRRRSSRGRRRG